MTNVRKTVCAAVLVAAFVIAAPFAFANEADVADTTTQESVAVEVVAEVTTPDVETPTTITNPTQEEQTETNEASEPADHIDVIVPVIVDPVTPKDLIDEELNDSHNGSVSPLQNNIAPQADTEEVSVAPQCSDGIDNELREFNLTALINGATDTKIDINDFALFASKYGQSASVAGNAHLDFDRNGVIDNADFEMFKTFFNHTTGDGLIDENDPACKDANGVYQPNHDSEYVMVRPVQACVITQSPNKIFDLKVDSANKINIADFALFASVYGSTGTDQAADFNNDGVVNYEDFLMFKEHFNTPVIEPVMDPNCGNTNGNNNNNGGNNDDDDDDNDRRGSSSRRRSSASTNDGRGGGSGELDGEVLGATICRPLITSYLQMGWNNNTEDVTKLQTFLAAYLGKPLTTTGMFDAATLAAVNEFQVKHGNEVLAPWMAFGHPGADVPTGFVYQTTKHTINKIVCGGVAPEPMPALKPFGM